MHSPPAGTTLPASLANDPGGTMSHRRLALAATLSCLGLATVPATPIAATAKGCKDVKTSEATMSKIKATSLSCDKARSLAKSYSKGFRTPKGYDCALKGSSPSFSVTCKRADPSRKLTFRLKYKQLVIPPAGATPVISNPGSDG